MPTLQASERLPSKLKPKLKMQEGESGTPNVIPREAELGERDEQEEEDSDMEPGVWDEDTLNMLIELSNKPRPPRRKCPFEQQQPQTLITDDILLRVSQLFDEEEAVNDFVDWIRQVQQQRQEQRRKQAEQEEREYTRRLSIKALEDQMQFERWCTCLDYV